MSTFKNFTDSRDGTVYPCVLMPDGKWWSAKNLAWAGSGRDYDDNPANRAVYGRYYEYSEALAAIPAGCHFATRDDYNAMHLASTGYDYRGATKMKKAGSIWNTPNGTDDFGFAAIPAGAYGGGNQFGGASFYGLGTICSFLDSSDYQDAVTYYNNDDNIYFQGVFGPVAKYPIRFIVDTFPPDFPKENITSISNVSVKTANRAFESESGLVRTIGSQGKPVLNAKLTWDVLDDELTLFNGWFDPTQSWTHANFPLLGMDVTVQPAGMPSFVENETGTSISLDVAIFPTAQTNVTAEFPTPVSFHYMGAKSGINYEEVQNVVSTSGRVSIREVTGSRGKQFKIAWMTTFGGAWQFFQWYIQHLHNGRKQFIGSICGKSGWLWKIATHPEFSIQADMVNISLTIIGRDARRALPVTIVVDGVNTLVHGNFANDARVFFAAPSNYSVEIPLTQNPTSKQITLNKDFLNLLTRGNYRVLVVSEDYVSEWKDWSLA